MGEVRALAQLIARRGSLSLLLPADFKVIVWNAVPLRDVSEEKKVSTKKALCTRSSHLGAVNCVRWSNSGKVRPHHILPRSEPCNDGRGAHRRTVLRQRLG